MLGNGILEIINFYSEDGEILKIRGKVTNIVRDSKVDLSMADIDDLFKEMVYEKLKDILVEKEGVDKNMIKYHVDTNDIDGAGTDFFLFGESLWNLKQLKSLLEKYHYCDGY
ncbi:hypothetical protein ACT3T2_13240 [Psychrobacter sp. 364]|uniref:hypothetical protein n=1 Tax=Psychrobacter sp. 364 TaxID=3457730 RepID=UPI0040373DCB